MPGAATVAAIALAVVLLWAAIAKVTHRTATGRAFAALGLPRPALLAVIVPVVEAAVAAALVVRPAAGAFAALVLLAAFTLVTVRALRARLPCACFGRPATAPTTGADVLRNGMLAALAILATGTPRPRRPDAVAAIAVVAVCLAGAVVLRVAQATQRERP
jgi:uncharacterized membrane protein YphA (DoxX/SURF4 family)